MEVIILFVLKVAWYSLPMGMANMTPVIFRKWFNFLAIPLDGNKKFRGAPILGKNKTLRGLLVGIMGGALMFIIQKYAYVYSDFFHNISIIDYTEHRVWLGSFMGLGAIIGDMGKSFFKRRVGKKPGTSWVPFDQIDYLIGGVLVSSILFVPPWHIFISALILGILTHIATTVFAKTIGLRRGGW